MLAYAKNMFALELLLLIYWAAFVSGDNYYTQKLDTFWPQNKTFLIEKFKHFTGEGLQENVECSELCPKRTMPFFESTLVLPIPSKLNRIFQEQGFVLT